MWETEIERALQSNQVYYLQPPVGTLYHSLLEALRTIEIDMNIQTIKETNWNAILDIQSEAYQEVNPENVEVLKSKWIASPETCFVCLSDQGKVLGYLLSHPWNNIEPPKLFEPLPNIQGGEHFYLHDMAISPQSKGQGLGQAMVKELFEEVQKKGVKIIRLVAVQGAESYWSIHGFKVVIEAKIGGVKIGSSYGKDAVLMEKTLLL